jgi:hypothetical protein
VSTRLANHVGFKLALMSWRVNPILKCQPILPPQILFKDKEINVVQKLKYCIFFFFPFEGTVELVS